MVINWTNMTDFSELPAKANEATSGTFWAGMLHMIWFILLISLIGYGLEVALLVSSFLAMVVALLLVYAGLVSWTILVEFVGIILFMFLYIMWSGSKK